MKKLSILIIMFFIIASITACGNINNKTVSHDDSAAETNESLIEIGKDFSELIPNGWILSRKSNGEIHVAEGDLNNDGINDKAAIIEKETTGDGCPSRALILAFGNKDNKYTLSTISEKALLKADESIEGDPLEGITINRGSILLNYYGEINSLWYQYYRFHFQDEDWYLIGATFGAECYTGEVEESDYNLLTGDYIEKKVDEEGNMVTTEGNRGKKELLKLNDFEIGLGKRQISENSILSFQKLLLINP